jgi:hypothetical protein
MEEEEEGAEEQTPLVRADTGYWNEDYLEEPEDEVSQSVALSISLSSSLNTHNTQDVPTFLNRLKENYE